MSNNNIDDLSKAFAFHAPGRFEFVSTGKASGCNSYDDSENKIRIWASTKNIPVATKGDDKGKLYKPLADLYEIRLVEIKPGDNSEKLQGSLHHCSVEFEGEYLEIIGETLVENRRPRESYKTTYALSMDDLNTPILYTALSYTWGPPVFDGTIECDGHEKAITKSLEAALVHFRKKDRSVVMRIDQICIDQENNKEKEQQIPLMGKIYEHAWNTLIWLGESSSGSDSAIRLLEDATICLQLITNDIGPADFERVGLPKPDSGVWHALWSLLRRPWFTRLWVVQEVMLSRNLWVACGDSLIGWRTLVNSCNQLSVCGIFRWLEQNFRDSADTIGRGDIQEALSHIKSIYESFEGKDPLFRLQVYKRYAECYYARDKIYGLLAVCDSNDRAAVRISYAKDCTAAGLHHDMTVHHLAGDLSGWRLVSVLSSVDHDSSDLPS